MLLSKQKNANNDNNKVRNKTQSTVSHSKYGWEYATREVNTKFQLARMDSNLKTSTCASKIMHEKGTRQFRQCSIIGNS